MKQSLTNGLYLSGLAAPALRARGQRPERRPDGWRNRLLAGEPYDSSVQRVAR